MQCMLIHYIDDAMKRISYFKQPHKPSAITGSTPTETTQQERIAKSIEYYILELCYFVLCFRRNK